MNGPEGVLALVFAQTLAGGIALLFCTPLWNEVKRGFFKLTGSMIVALSVATWALVRGDAPVAGWAALGVAVATALWLVLLQARRITAARVVGFVTVPAAAVLLGACAAAGEAAFALAMFQMLAAAAFLGSVMNGLLLGHWYLTDRGLSRTPINRYANVLIAATAVEFLAVLTMGFGANEGSSTFNPLLTSVGGLSSWIALGMVAATGLIAALIKGALRGKRASAVQSATGFFYLAVLTAFTAGLAAMVGFLPAS